MKIFSSLLILLGSITNSFSEIKISPELDSFIELKPIPVELFQNNAYVGWVGINYPGEDWLIVNREIYQHNDAVLNQRMRDGSIAISFVFDPLQKALQLPENLGVLPRVSRPQDQDKEHELLYLSSYFKKSESFLTFKQDFLTNKQYFNTRDFFVCKDYLNINCLAEMMDYKLYINEVISGNAKILARFRELLLHSDYNYELVYNDLNVSAAIRPSPSTTRIYQLNITDGIMDIMNNQVDQGLDKLVLARKFIDLSYAEKASAATLHLVIGITYTQFLDQTMDALLSSGLLADYLDDERMAIIMQPYDQNIGYKLNQSIIEVMKKSFKSISYPFVKIYTTAPKNVQLSEEDEYILLLYLQEQMVMMPPTLIQLSQALGLKKLSNNWLAVDELSELNKKISIFPVIVAQTIEVGENTNEEGCRLDDSINLPRAALEQWYTNFFHKIGMSPREAIAYLNTKYSSLEFFNDYYEFLQKMSIKNSENIQLTSEVIDELLVNNIDLIIPLIPYMEFDQYWRRLYEQQNYHQMVYLKYLIMKDNIPPSKISEFLASMGNLAKNTITQANYNYDPDKKLLSTPLPKESKYMPSNIKEAHFEDKSISNFQVIIP